MKKIISVFFLVAALGTGAYYWWQINHPPAIVAWNLITEQALVVYERSNPSTISDKDWLLTSAMPDSLLKRVRSSKELLISLHVIGKEEMGTVLYLPLSPSPQTDITSLTSGRRFTERNFEGFKIIEVPIANKKIISVATIGQILIISSTSFLIEDVIRLARLEEQRNFVTSNKALFQFVRMESEGGHVYINLSQLPTFLDFFLLRKNQDPQLNRFAQSGVVDIKKQDHALLFSGFAVDSIAKGPSILSLFNQQRPVKLSLQPFISSRTGLVVTYGITDYATWTTERNNFCKSLHAPALDSLKSLQERTGFDADGFYFALGDETGLCMGGVFAGDLLITEIKNEERVRRELRKLSDHRHDSIPIETYSNYEINWLPTPALTSSLFWPLTSRDMNYYVIVDHHIIFSEEVDDLKSYLDDLDGENTWGKATAWNEFLSTSQETNIGVIFDGLNGWPSLRQFLTPRWQNIGDSTSFLNVNRGSLQFTRLEKSYYLNGVLGFNPNPSSATLKQKEKVTEINLADPVAMPLAVVKNHSTKGSELLTQDRANNLQLFSSKLKNLFKIKIDGPIRSEVSQIDYYKNKKLQYLFATDRKIYLIDRLGNNVDGFPKPVPLKTPIHYLTVVDYDHSDNYRFLISDKQGSMNLLNREARPVTEWKTIDLKKDLSGPPQVIRSKGVDYLFAVSQDGIVYGFNRKGEPLTGFPVSLKIRPAGDWVMEKNDDRDLITLISGDGLFIQLDTKGTVINRNNLVKSSASSKFSLTANADGHYVIGRIDKSKIAVLAGSGNILIEQDNPGSGDLYLTYYEAGRGKKLYGFTDPQQEFSYFFNEKGKAIFSRPLENEMRPAITVDRSGNFYFYSVTKSGIQSYKPARTP